MTTRMNTFYPRTKTASGEILEKLQEISEHITNIEKVVDSLDKRVDVIECHVNALVDASTLPD